jgi:tetratricopeptide (TPR) repeat protein
MLAKKNISEDGRWKIEDGIRHAIEKFHSPFSIFHPLCFIFLVFALFLAGCTPSGPRALLNGKKLLEQGDYAGAAAQFKIATTFLATNAQAWNYLGVACQHAGQTDAAVMAYQNALKFNRDLMEAHYNLGCLWLEQNKPDAAESEFTAYTLRRSKAPEGWLKLGLAQLRLEDLAGAEKSFSTVLYLNPNNAQALNGFGLARIERGHPREAAQFFAAAAREKPDYGPALLNLATVAQQYLRDNAMALQNYRAYLALTPRPANWEAVNDIANGLEQPAAVAAANPLPAGGAVHAAAPPRTQAVARASSNPPRGTATPVTVVKNQPEPVVVQPEPVIIGTPLPAQAAEGNPVSSAPLPPANASPTAQTAFTSAPAPVVAPKPVKIVQPAPPAFPRYLYLSPRKPVAGDRRTASGAFTRAREFEQDSRWLDAMQSYRQAGELDPAWFEAQYNYGVMAYRLRNYNQSLAAYEMALAIQPDSAGARYNFALALEAAGYMPDAVNELEKIVAVNPNEVRAHLALGNLYAQQLRDPVRARQHYLKVLAVNPGNPQAGDIQFWLSSNPP